MSFETTLDDWVEVALKAQKATRASRSWRYPSSAACCVTGGIFPAIGARWLFGEGPYLSLHMAYFHPETAYGSPTDYETRERAVLGITAGSRLRPYGRSFIDLGIGLAVQLLHSHGVAEIGSGPGSAPFDNYSVRPGFIWNVPIPDVDLAVGIEF